MKEKKVPGVHAVLDHLKTAIGDDQGDRHAGDHFGGRRTDRLHPTSLVSQLVEPFDQLVGKGRFIGLAVVGLDLAHALKGLLQTCGQTCCLRMALSRDLAHAPADTNGDHRSERNADEGEAGKPPVLIETSRPVSATIVSMSRATPVNAMETAILSCTVSLSEAGNERPWTSLQKIAEIGVHEMAENPLLQIRDDPLADPAHQHAGHSRTLPWPCSAGPR